MILLYLFVSVDILVVCFQVSADISILVFSELMLSLLRILLATRPQGETVTQAVCSVPSISVSGGEQQIKSACSKQNGSPGKIWKLVGTVTVFVVEALLSWLPAFSDRSEEMKSEWVDFLVPVEIFREGTQSAWGFRLRGGSDVDGGTPLEIIKVTRDLHNPYSCFDIWKQIDSLNNLGQDNMHESDFIIYLILFAGVCWRC